MPYGPDEPRIQAHLCVAGARHAIDFYARAFDAVATQEIAAPDGERLMHASLSAFGGEFFLNDEFPEHGGSVRAPSFEHPTTVVININLEAPAAVDAMIARAQAAGATIAMAAQDTFWGARYGRVVDPFGHVWAFSAAFEPAMTGPDTAA